MNKLRTKTEPSPDPVDLSVGAAIRIGRTMQGMSQSELGQAVGVTFQQIQKYECGRNRVAASVLYRISRALDVSVIEFFAGWDGILPDEPRIWLSAAEKRLLITYRAIRSQRERENILHLAEDIAAYRLDE